MLHKTTKIIVIAGSLYLILSIAVYVVFFQMVTKQKMKFTEQTIERVQAEYYHKSLSALMETLEKTKGDRENLISRVLKEEDVINFLALVESLGKEQGVSLSTNSLTVEPIDAVFETLIVNVSVEGQYAGVLHVLKILEHLPYQVSVTKFQITRSSAEGSVWKSTYDVRVTKFKKNEI